MATSYSKMAAKLDEIAEKSVRFEDVIFDGRRRLIHAQTKLTEMQSEYSSLVADINQAAIDNPTDEDYQRAKSIKDKLVIDFQNLKSYATALISAYDGVIQ